MQFNEKIHLLMKMSNITNNTLAKALDVDPSLVSRWRTGSREPGDDSRYIQMIGVFFASQAKQDFQKVAILEITGHQMEDKQIGEPLLAQYLTRWLSNESKISRESMNLLIDSISSVGTIPYPQKEIQIPSDPVGKTTECQQFFGNKGLQQAVIKLLRYAVVEHQGAGQLYLFSDEPMDWIISNPDFFKNWGQLLFAVIKKGIKIKIIHTLYRDSNELAIAVQKWTPYYLTGAIESYYYPHKRDGLFNHTLFVMQDEVAITSFSSRTQHRDQVQYLFSAEPSVVEYALLAYESLLRQSKPLVRTYTGKRCIEYIEQQTNFFITGEKFGVGMQSFPHSGMPPKLLEHMLQRMFVAEDEIREIVENQKRRMKAMENYLQNKEFTMVISFPRITDVLKERVPAILPELVMLGECFFTPHELHSYICTLIDLLQTYKNLQLVILPHKHMLHHVHIFVMQDVGMILLKDKNPKFVFMSEQRDLISAMLSFIQQEINIVPKRERHKDFVIEKLQLFAQKIMQGIQKNKTLL